MALDWLLRPVSPVFIIVFVLQSTCTTSIIQSEALIKLKNSFTNTTALSSWVPGSAPCDRGAQWDGLLCSNGVVIGLRLENMGLSGKIDVDALVAMSGLRSVSFEYNSFSGLIPEFSRLGYLKNIFLTGNQFSGEIPPEFFLRMESLKKVWLSKNKFSGNIPLTLLHLSNLIELRLEDNQFTGTIPSVEETRLKSFNVSNNKLSGVIPQGLTKFNKSSFQGNDGLCGENIGKVCNAANTPIETLDPGAFATTSAMNITKNDAISIKKTGAGIIVLALMFLCVVVMIILKMRKKEKEDFEAGGMDNNTTDQEAAETVEVQVSMPVLLKEVDLNKKPGPSRRAPATAKGGIGELIVMNNEKGAFGLIDLMRAAAEVLGNGGLGSSYKALMDNGVTVVVKRLREMNALGKDGFDAEIRRLGSLRHHNILPPLAFHYRKDEKLLIYEYIPKGSLLNSLHGDKGSSHCELNWPDRLKIVQGIARGLGYLHTELASYDLPHGNLKSSNVLLSPDNEPLLSEYGFSPLTNPSVIGQAQIAYKAPEIAKFGISPKCDVYCLGLIILEILTGKYPCQYINNDTEGIDLVQFVEPAISAGKECEILDPGIASSSNSLGGMKQLLHIGVHCAANNPTQRLDLREAIRRIESIKLEITAPDSRTIEVLPSLKDSYADSPAASTSTQQGSYADAPAASTSTQQGHAQKTRKEYGSQSFTDSELFSFASPRSNLSNEK